MRYHGPTSSTAQRPQSRRARPPSRCAQPCRQLPGQLGGWHTHCMIHAPADGKPFAFREWFSTLVQTPTESAPGAIERNRPGPRRDFLEARQVSLFQLFDGQEFKFDVPSYQRPYSWGIKQVHELLQDFLASYHAKSEYFLGAVVTVRGEDGPGAAMQVIDGQQRLTSLLIMLAYVHAWAKDTHNEVLEQRIKRMLYIEPDALDPSPRGRFRLQLREGDDTFFVRNLLSSWLPIQYELSGVAAQQPVTAAGRRGAGAGGGAGGGSGGGGSGGARPLENESWWRMYENAAYIRSTLSAAMDDGLNLQDFIFHVLRNCHVVLMTARDEAASFRIFSTINSRGMDLTMVDKLKADVLEVLEPVQRKKYSAAWSEMEDILGRSAFHRVFDHMRSLAVVMNPEVQHMSVLEYFSHQRRDPALVAATIGCALDYARTLLQLRQCRFEVSPSSPHATTLSATPAGPATRSVPHQLLAADGQGGIVTAYDDGGPESAVHTYGAVRSLERQARHMSLFSDDAWVPATLDFFQQVQDMEYRTRFLQAAETLQLYLELCRDAGSGAARWQSVAGAVMRRDGADEAAHLQAVFAVLVLTQQEKSEFRLKLHHKDLVSLAPRRTLAHLLLRAEGGAVSASPSTDFAALHVEKVVPAAPPDGSAWRRTKLCAPTPTTTTSTTNTTTTLTTSTATTAPATASSRSRSVSTSGNGSSTAAGSPPAASHGVAGVAGATSGVLAGPAGAAARSASRRRSPGGDGVKYWFEVQRMFWHGKLGNLILLPTTLASTSHSLMDADYDVKATYYKSCGVEATLPEWSGSVVSGRYSRHRFSFEECKARHTDLHARLVEVFRLAEDDEEDPLEVEEEDWPEESVY